MPDAREGVIVRNANRIMVSNLYMSDDVSCVNKCFHQWDTRLVVAQLHGLISRERTHCTVYRLQQGDLQKFVLWSSVSKSFFSAPLSPVSLFCHSEHAVQCLDALPCRTDTILEALEEYLDCNIPSACKGATDIKAREQNLRALVSLHVLALALALHP
jgi:hypothetical protein